MSRCQSRSIAGSLVEGRHFSTHELSNTMSNSPLFFKEEYPRNEGEVIVKQTLQPFPLRTPAD